LSAIGIRDGDTIAHTGLKTAGAPVRIRLSADRDVILCDGQDLSFVTVELVDSFGQRHPFADSLVHFEISGPGDIVAVGNSNPMSTESFQQNQRTAFLGRCLVVIKSQNSGGRIRLRASAETLGPASIVINSKTRI
jgi:beta-galactosidase